MRFLHAPGIADHLPTVAGEGGAMDYEGADGAVARGLFELVGPAAVIGKRFALEEVRVVGNRLVHEEQGHFALEVDAFVIVPLLLGWGDALAHQSDGSI